VSHGLGIVLVAGTAGGRWFSQHGIDRDQFIQYETKTVIAVVILVGAVCENVPMAKWLYYKIL
jgi:hypothetical protein